MHMKSNNMIVIIDSDDEHEPAPTPKKRTPIIDVDAVSIDLTDDDPPPIDNHYMNSKPNTLYTPPKQHTISPAYNKNQDTNVNSQPVRKPMPSAMSNSSRTSSPIASTLPMRGSNSSMPREKAPITSSLLSTVSLSRPKVPSVPPKPSTSFTPRSTQYNSASRISPQISTSSTQPKASRISPQTSTSSPRPKAPSVSSQISTSSPRPKASTSSPSQAKTPLPSPAQKSPIPAQKSPISSPAQKSPISSPARKSPILAQNSPIPFQKKLVTKTKAPVVNNRPIVIPEKWNSPSSLESRTSKALLAKISSSLPERKLSVPRSKLLQNSTSTIKRTSSSILKAPRKPISLKRPIESPERPTHSTRSVFGSPLSHSSETSSVVYGSPERSTPPTVHGSPERSAIHRSPERPTPPTVHGSPVRSSAQMFTAFSDPTLNNPRRPKSFCSPFSNNNNKQSAATKAFYHLDDEDGSEQDLESFVSVIAATRKKAAVDNTPKSVSMQCPVCYLMYPKMKLIIHASECTGPSKEQEEIEGVRIIGKKRGIRKNTIAAAVAMDESERKRLNKGKIDMGNTNYYADSEGALAMDGTGFGAEVTGMTWESAGQTTFS